MLFIIVQTKENNVIYEQVINNEVRKYTVNLVQQKAAENQEDYSDIIHLINQDYQPLYQVA